ncbi:hypothetical protein CHU92_07750 [Flavobacterium cyanobacteriorum]|uniref:OmpA-like domain-containing protein n=1 Tax=Flavobacterium cyanobacteriorum TaxID=2022802 RepID=A0A255Z9S0_9FLAO|nr:OmpA family protein [Flavobacterium cyanobacteriorum]OYQ37644.1 hypothetical protein CHU92_07750 [Flavobacterium cyanobacteriorum]
MKAKFIYITLICCSVANGQQKLKQAEKLFDEMAYVAAAKAYEEYFKKAKSEKPQGKSLLNMADAYYFTRDYGKAAAAYQKITLDDVHFNRYIQSLRIQKQYQEADRLMEGRLANNPGQLDRYHRQKKYLDSICTLRPVSKVTNVATVNTDKSDFGTAFYGSKTVFCSSKDTLQMGGKTYQYNMQPYLELYVADRNEADGMLINPKKFVAKSQINYHNAVAAFSPDLHIMYYSANIVKSSGKLHNSKAGTNNLGIFYGQPQGDYLREVKALPFNSIDYSVAQPALSKDGRWLYFVSDMPGGYGETDIYKVAVMPDGTFGKPLNLGPVINTPFKEMFPFVNDEALYFASEGHYGLGGLDIFKSEIAGESFTEPQNEGVPMNSNGDDFALTLSDDGSYGYFSSNRNGGMGDDDIYYFTKEKPCVQQVTGYVIHQKTSQTVKGAKVTGMGTDGRVLASAETDAGGFYVLALLCDATITIAVTAEDFAIEKTEVATPLQPGGLKLDLKVKMYTDLIKKEEGVEKIAINPIYFDLDKYNITPQAAAELDKVVDVLKRFPVMVIKIESHTDSRASDDYNITLSQNRAKATYNYILSKNIDPQRIESVTGYGETRLLNGCGNGVPCTEAQHQLNRRSEFIIVKK